jgi:hypothetical protein
VLVACVDLPEVPGGTCGNHVIEAREDCDGFPDASHEGPGLACVQCSYACDPNAAVITCPSGWGCGVDGRCRHGTGTFEPASSEPEVFPTSELVVGDRDGDVAMELIGGGDGHVGTLTAPNRQVGYTIVKTFGSTGLAAADLDGDGLTDVLRPSFGRGVAGSTGVRGGAPRTMLALGTFDIDPATPGDQPAPPLTTLVTVRQNDGSAVPYAVMPQPSGLAWLDLSRVAAEAPAATGIQGDPASLLIAVGNIDAGVLKRGEEIAIGFAGGTALYVRRPNFDAFLTITLPAPLVAAPIFGDVDADGFVDLLAPIGSSAAVVANGDGTTLATTAVLDAAFAGQMPATCELGSSSTVGAVPWLIADLGGNGIVDYVTRDGIVLRLPNGTYCRAFVANLSSEASAVALDANGDGRLDVAIASGIDTNVTLAVSTPAVGQGGVSFESHSIDVSDVPIELRAGAFDWDRFDDLLVVEAPNSGVTRVEIAKGTNIAASQIVLSAPDVPGLSALSSGPYGASDGIADLVMLGTEPGRDAPYLAEVRLIGEGTEFFSDVVGPALGRVTTILIGALGGTPGQNDMVAIFDDPVLHETTVWVFPDQGSYLTDRGAYEAAVVTSENAASTLSLADLDGDGIDELVVADDQGLAIYDLVHPASPPLRLAAPAATTLTAVRRAGGDCVLLGSELAGAALECDLLGAPTSVVLTTSPVFGAVTVNIDGDPELEAVLVLESSLETYELDPAVPRDTFALDTTHVAPAHICSGDFDGDGVRDLAVTSDATVQLWWGVPHDQERP